MIELANRSGLTLIELIVVLALIGIMASVVAVSVRIAASPVEPVHRVGATQIIEARREALERRRSVTVEVEANGQRYEATVFPDGTVIADSALDVDPFTGRTDGAR